MKNIKKYVSPPTTTTSAQRLQSTKVSSFDCRNKPVTTSNACYRHEHVGATDPCGQAKCNTEQMPACSNEPLNKQSLQFMISLSGLLPVDLAGFKAL